MNPFAGQEQRHWLRERTCHSGAKTGWDKLREHVPPSPPPLWPPVCSHVSVYSCPASAGRHKRHRFDPWVGKLPWRRAWQPALVFLPEKSHGQRSLVGYSPGGHKESAYDWATQPVSWVSSDMHHPEARQEKKIFLKMVVTCWVELLPTHTQDSNFHFGESHQRQAFS